MDTSDRIESRDPLAIPEHLVFAFEEWIAELIREACDDDSPETRDAVIKAVHFHDAFGAGSMTPAQLAELAEGAAGWMEPKWPSDPADADEVERLLGVSRELLELRDRVLAVGEDDNISRVVVIEPGRREVLRSQTLAILDFIHDRFDEARDLEPSKLLVAASLFRDAITVLDIIGWVAGEQDQRPARVTMTRGHLAQLEWLRGDVAMSIVTSLDDRESTTEADDIAALEENIRTARCIVHDLWEILHAPAAQDLA
ncbi:MAG: hypothetical protein JWM93_321 [Frankiales bacterium]|nr:hypothetical protein [Frankiales bacterium]